MWGLFSSWGESPLRIGCKVSVMVSWSAVVLDNVTRWKWVKEIGNHQYAPCVNWRRSWFMAPGYSAHTCWIYSFFSPSPGSRTGKGAFLSPQPIATVQSVALCDRHPQERPVLFKMNWAPSIGSTALQKKKESRLYQDLVDSVFCPLRIILSAIICSRLLDALQDNQSWFIWNYLVGLSVGLNRALKGN